MNNLIKENQESKTKTVDLSLILIGLEKAITNCLNKLDLDYYKLNMIVVKNKNKTEGKDAFEGMLKINKLKSIAYDLEARIIDHLRKVQRSATLIADKSNQSAQVDQFMFETELLGDMLYNVSKENFKLINQKFKMKLVLRQNKAA